MAVHDMYVTVSHSLHDVHLKVSGLITIYKISVCDEDLRNTLSYGYGNISLGLILILFPFT